MSSLRDPRSKDSSISRRTNTIPAVYQLSQVGKSQVG